MYPPPFLPHFPYINEEQIFGTSETIYETLVSGLPSGGLSKGMPFLFHYCLFLCLWILPVVSGPTWDCSGPLEAGILAPLCPLAIVLGSQQHLAWWDFSPIASKCDKPLCVNCFSSLAAPNRFLHTHAWRFPFRLRHHGTTSTIQAQYRS